MSDSIAVKGSVQMQIKRTLVRYFVNWTDGWNKEFHNAIETKVSEGYRDYNPDCNGTLEEIAAEKDKIRTFYYGRMLGTATLLIGMISALLALMAIVITIYAAWPSKASAATLLSPCNHFYASESNL